VTLSPPTVSRAGTVYAAIVDRAVDANRLVHMVAHAGAGATALFLGTVRNTHDGRAVVGIDYQAYGAMAERELLAIVDEAADRYGTRSIAVEHRVGFLEIGDTSVAIAASHERRGPSFDATRYVIEQIKQRLPVWKREHYADGTREWVDPSRSLRSAASAAAEGA
jgi:molybdopterin synthase catalytic subunit